MKQKLYSAFNTSKSFFYHFQVPFIRVQNAKVLRRERR